MLLQHAGRGIGTRRHHPVQILPQRSAVTFLERAARQATRLGIPQIDLVVIVLAEHVGGDHRLTQHALARLQIVGVNISQGLENSSEASESSLTPTFLLNASVDERPLLIEAFVKEVLGQSLLIGDSQLLYQ